MSELKLLQTVHFEQLTKQLVYIILLYFIFIQHLMDQYMEFEVRSPINVCILFSIREMIDRKLLMEKRIVSQDVFTKS